MVKAKNAFLRADFIIVNKFKVSVIEINVKKFFGYINAQLNFNNLKTGNLRFSISVKFSRIQQGHFFFIPLSP